MTLEAEGSENVLFTCSAKHCLYGARHGTREKREKRPPASRCRRARAHHETATNLFYDVDVLRHQQQRHAPQLLVSL